MGSLSLTASKAIQRRGFGPLLPGVYHAPYPDVYRPPLGTTAESCSRACVDFIEHQLFANLVSPDEVAAIVVEPIQGEGGYVVAPDEFLQRLRELTTKHGILLVVDEVQSGMGRSGKMFAIEFTGVEPDMMSIAKGIASGMPLGVAVARAGLMAWPPGSHASTFGGNPVSCAAALAVLRTIEDERLLDQVKRVGEHLADALAELPDVRERRGVGVWRAVRLSGPHAPAVEAAARDHGLLVNAVRPDTLRLAPPLVLTEADADEALPRLHAALIDVTGGHGASPRTPAGRRW
jgi:4-aminobutyrate aminotransferase